MITPRATKVSVITNSHHFRKVEPPSNTTAPIFPSLASSPIIRVIHFTFSTKAIQLVLLSSSKILESLSSNRGMIRRFAASGQTCIAVLSALLSKSKTTTSFSGDKEVAMSRASPVLAQFSLPTRAILTGRVPVLVLLKISE